ncbi:MAG: hypothetical protein AAFY99_06985 [Pseudomonadota bacterium]
MTLSFASFAMLTPNSHADSGCTVKEHVSKQNSIGFELIDLMRGEAWVTIDWTVEEYAEFSPGLTGLNWIKNEPRTGLADRMRVYKSPGCSNEGQFKYKEVFGRKFFHIADVVARRRTVDPQGLIAEVRVVKYHSLFFDPGSTISTLKAPNGDVFVGVNDMYGNTTPPTLPEGWVIEAQKVDAHKEIRLFGEVRVLRLKNGLSFQAVAGDALNG